MKPILFFVFILGSTLTFAQSAKKVNKQLRAELEKEKYKQDSMYTVFLQDRNLLDKLQGQTLGKLSSLVTGEQKLKRSIASFEDKRSVLKELGFDPGTLVSDSVLPKNKYATSREMREIVKEALGSYFSYDAEKRNGSDLDQYKVKEQNLRLIELISSYRDHCKSNQLNENTQREYIALLESFEPQLDRLIEYYKDLTLRADKAFELVEEKTLELEANYRQKGPKGFPEAYRRIFPEIHPTPVVFKNITDDPVELSETDGEGNVVGMIYNEPVSPKREIYTVVDEDAQYPGGMSALKRYLFENIHYPEIAKELGIDSKLVVQFVVQKDGSLSDVRMKKPIAECPECDAEVILVIGAMPKWIPAKVNGKVVDSMYTLPISIHLD